MVVWTQKKAKEAREQMNKKGEKKEKTELAIFGLDKNEATFESDAGNATLAFFIFILFKRAC